MRAIAALRRVSWGMTVGGVLTFANVGCAQEAPELDATAVAARHHEDDIRTEEGTRRWYGWQTFSADGLAAALFVGAWANHDNTALLAGSTLTFAFGAPSIHLVHRNSGVAVASLLLRVLAPLIGAGIGSTRDVNTEVDEASPGASSSGTTDDTKWTKTGIAIGGLVASAIDGLVLSYDTKPVTAPARAQYLHIEPFPSVVVTGHGLTIGLCGTL